MRTANTNIAELRHIVDVDGQLIGIGPSQISAAVLRALGRVKGELFQVFGEREVPLQSQQSICLHEDEVLFFRSRPASASPNKVWRQAA